MAGSPSALPSMSSRRMPGRVMRGRSMAGGSHPGTPVDCPPVRIGRVARVTCRRVMARRVMAGRDMLGVIHLMRVLAIPLGLHKVRAAVCVTIVPVVGGPIRRRIIVGRTRLRSVGKRLRERRQVVDNLRLVARLLDLGGDGVGFIQATGFCVKLPGDRCQWDDSSPGT